MLPTNDSFEYNEVKFKYYKDGMWIPRIATDETHVEIWKPHYTADHHIFNPTDGYTIGHYSYKTHQWEIKSGPYESLETAVMAYFMLEHGKN